MSSLIFPCIGSLLNAQSLSSLSAEKERLFTLQRVSINGNNTLSSVKLEGYYPIGQLTSHTQLLEIHRTVIAAAQNEGYFHFRLDSLRLDFPMDSSRGSLSLYLHEGARFMLRDVVFEPDALIIPREELRLGWLAYLDQPFRSDVIESCLSQNLTQYENAGYPFARLRLASVETDGDSFPEDSLGRQADEAGVRLTIAISEGPYTYIDGFRFLGLETTKPTIIQREIPLKIFDRYQENVLQSIPLRLRRVGLFEEVILGESVYILSARGSDTLFGDALSLPEKDTLRAIVTLTLRESNPNNFDGIVGYQPALGPGDEGFFTGQINFSLRNLFGTGRRLAVRWQRPNAATQDVRLTYFEPWLFDIPLSLSLELMQLKQDSTFSQLQYGISGLYRLTDNLTVSASLSQEMISPIFESASPWQTIFQTSVTVSGIGIQYDSRDFPINPQSGWLLRNEYRIGTKSLIANDSLLALFGLRTSVLQQRISLDVEFYQKLFFRQVLFFRIHGLAILSEELLFNDFVRLGGATSLRGYREQQFIASRYLITGLEYRFLLSPRTFFFGFLDGGYYFRPPNPVLQGDRGESGFKPGYGFGFRFETPLGLTGFTFALGEGDSFLQGKVHLNIINEF